ncbi:MAG: putative sporulation protein YtxC [Bacillota bacterium]|nr:putative sporulation protein YtxC [Bacillota bacterium]
MLLLCVIYEGENEDVMNGIENIKYNFERKNVAIGISESIENKTHFVKIFCSDDDYTEKVNHTFNIYMAEVLYDAVIKEFIHKSINSYLTENYFFLKYDEIQKIRTLCYHALKCNGAILDENEVYFNNRKISITRKIVDCIEENSDINIKGFLTFRMGEFKEDLCNSVDKVVENFMVEKEYEEFIKLLKYFVEIQQSKVEQVNIYIERNGNYIIKDKLGNDIMDDILSELSDTKYTGSVSMDDMIISGLITLAPGNIIFHCVDNCVNKELINTIKSVFLDRVEFCEECNTCKEIKGQYIKS